MIWATRLFKINGWFDISETFDQMFTGLGGPRDMILLGQNEPPNKRLFVGLPNEDLLSAFPGFEAIAEANIPETVDLLNGHDDVYRAKFPFGFAPKGG